MKTALDVLSQAVAAKPTRLLIIGGHAMQVYGVIRQTLDVDCLVTDKDLPALRELLTNAGYREVSGTDNFVRFRHKSPYLMDMDVLLVDASTFDHLHQNSREYSIDAPGLRMPALQHLIALKLHALKNAPARETKDLPDILELLKRNPSVLSEKEFACLCERFGPAGIMKKIKQWLP